MPETTVDTTNDTHFFNELEYKGIVEVLREAILTDPIGGAISMDEFSNAVHEGIAFSISEDGQLAATGGADTHYFLGRTGSKEMHFAGFHMNASNGNFTVHLYEAPTLSADGTPVTPINRNRASATVSTVSAFFNPTVTSTGTFLEHDHTYDTGGVGSNLASGAGELTIDWVLAANTDYLIEIVNLNATTLDYTIKFQWAEREPIV